MAARLDSVAKYICERGNWEVTNLQLQKILYLSQMLHIGQHGERLVDADFQAWDYGPVEPNLYRKVRLFGSRPIRDVFFDARPFRSDDPKKATLDDACNVLLQKKPGELVDITHWQGGAWAKNYVPNCRGIRIPDGDIADEYKRRIAA